MRFKGILPVVLTLLNAPVLANVLGVNIQHFNPSANGRDFITVNSSRNLAPAEFGGSFFLNYAQNNLLIYDLPIIEQKKIERKDYLVGADITMAYGINPNLEFGLMVPGVIAQDIDDATYRKVFVSTGLLELRPQLKYSTSENKNEGGVAFIGSVDTPNVKNDPYMGLAARPVLNLEVAFDGKDANSAWAVNAGYRIRSPGNQPEDSPMFPLDDQYIFSAAYGVNFGEKYTHRWVTELITSFPAKKEPYKNTTDISSGELMMAMKSAIKKGMFYTIGAGFEVLPESMSPDFRAFAGLQMYFEPEVEYKEILVDEKVGSKDDSLADTMTPYIDDADSDGIKDSKDLCPETPEKVKVDYQGCPSDDDGDGVANYEDKCLGTPNGSVVDKKGCEVFKDADFDGVPNAKDQCPNTPAGAKVDQRGCTFKRK